jgi:hypothetical protein
MTYGLNERGSSGYTAQARVFGIVIGKRFDVAVHIVGVQDGEPNHFIGSQGVQGKCAEANQAGGTSRSLPQKGSSVNGHR